MNPNESNVCLLCESSALAVCPTNQPLPGVASDDRPWQGHPSLAVCRACGHVQAVLTDHWRAEIQSVYDSYGIYSAGDGAEPLVLEGGGMPRSEALLDHLHSTFGLAPEGALLDFGCGNGAFLHTYHRQRPHWQNAGHDANASFQARVLAVPGVQTFASEGLPDGPFNLITAMHVMEHLPSPVATLNALRQRLAPGGRIVIVVPDFQRNPFDLMVVDHCSHFTEAGFSRLAAAAGCQLEHLDRDCMPRAFVAILSPISPGALSTELESSSSVASTTSALRWLTQVREQLLSFGGGQPVAIFGTGTASAWLTAVLNGDVSCYLDEAANRIGHTHLGKPVLSPKQLAEDAPLYIGLPTEVALAIRARLERDDSDPLVCIPPPFPAELG
ncbi:MAG: SAM-dependent methyltransferase [Rhodothermales bacterium]|jgi:SAM-dependent methyltransferase